MNCPKCGNISTQQEKFCSKCGTLMPVVPEMSVSEAAGSSLQNTFCGKCGSPMTAGQNACGNCGMFAERATYPSILGNPSPFVSTQKNKNDFVALQIMSIITLVGILFVPLFRTGFGDSVWLPDILELLIDSYSPLESWAVLFSLPFFITVVPMVISAFLQVKWMAITASVCSIIFSFGNILRYLDQFDRQIGIDYFFEYSILSAGFWIVLALYMVCFICALIARKQKNQT